jgi:hypothetical protein
MAQRRFLWKKQSSQLALPDVRPFAMRLPPAPSVYPSTSALHQSAFAVAVQLRFPENA